MKLKFTAINYLRTLAIITLGSYNLKLTTRANAQSVNNNKVNVGFAYPISSNGTYAAAANTNIFSMNVIARVFAGEKGISFAGISSVVK